MSTTTTENTTGYCTNCNALVSELNPGKLCGKCRFMGIRDSQDTPEAEYCVSCNNVELTTNTEGYYRGDICQYCEEQACNSLPTQE